MNGHIAIITFHRALNYGAVLQAYALQKILLDGGFDAKIIDYRCNFIETLYKPFGTKNLHSPKYKVVKLLKSFSLLKKRRAFDEFSKKHLALTEPFKSAEELSEISRGFDIIISGSDQVFNPAAAGDEYTYFLDFVPDEIKKISYGASFGFSDFDQNVKKYMGSLLSRFSAVSVRETTGAALVREMTGRDAPVVLDPTFLFDKETWEKIAEKPNKIPEKYVLVYMMEGCIHTINKARELAKKRGCGLVLLNPTFKQQLRCRDFIRLSASSPEEFVWLFAHAEAVVTNSFHGMAFSLIFEKDFYVEASNGDKASRITDLLCELGLSGRLLPTEDDVPIDYGAVRDLLGKLRARSRGLLFDMCGE